MKIRPGLTQIISLYSYFKYIVNYLEIIRISSLAFLGQITSGRHVGCRPLRSHRAQMIGRMEEDDLRGGE